MNDSVVSRKLWLRKAVSRAVWGARKALPFFSGMLAALAGMWLYFAIIPPAQPLTIKAVKQAAAEVMASATPAPAYATAAFQIIRPSLVLIQATVPGESSEDGHSLGSGVVVNQNGQILTALHVVANATKIQLVFADGSESTAQVVGTQVENDIAVLMPDQPPAQIFPAVLGNPRAMQVGDEAYAVGNPFGLYGSFSAGVISGFDRSFRVPGSDTQLQGLIQIDTAVNPGNSGGPLINRYGEVIGIVEGIVNPTGQDVFIGIGFAVPINVAGGAVNAPPY